MSRWLKIPTFGKYVTIPTSYAQGCEWCLEGKRPTTFTEATVNGLTIYTGKGICQSCVRSFKTDLASTKWNRDARGEVFSRFPLCVSCCSRVLYKPIVWYQNSIIDIKLEISQNNTYNTVREARYLDHIRPWRYYPDLFWDHLNWQPLCFLCHDAKSRAERG